MDVLDPGLRGPSGVIRPPTLALIISAPEPSDGPSLIGTNDVDALFHEYGHVLDFALEPSPYAINRPEVWVQTDWIEGPSGFLGRWGRHPDVIAAFGRHRQTGAPIPSELLEPLERAEALNVALRQLRFLSMAKLDLLIHGEAPISVADALRRTWPLRGTTFPEGTAEPATIPHLMAGYDCAIYGFVWSTALSDDLLSRFEARGMTSPELGMAYRRQILEVPWTADPLAAHAAFMGRPWSIDALIARVGRSHGQTSGGSTTSRGETDGAPHG
jgi:Zn-dependent oligopeptidase